MNTANDDDPALRILNAINARLAKEENIRRLPTGVSAVHVIDAARTFGDAREIAGNLLVEDTSGAIRRINGAQLAELAQLEPDFVRRFRQMSV